MTIAEKKELILIDANLAYRTFIKNDELNTMFNVMRHVAMRTITDIDGCCSFTEQVIAEKNTLLGMLHLELI